MSVQAVVINVIEMLDAKIRSVVIPVDVIPVSPVVVIHAVISTNAPQDVISVVAMHSA